MRGEEPKDPVGIPGKIYVGLDLTGTALYMGSPSTYEPICADLELEPGQFELTLRKEILWESETATDSEVRTMEWHFICETGANNPRDRLQPHAALARRLGLAHIP